MIKADVKRYDPWQVFNERKRLGNEPSPYVELINVLDTLGIRQPPDAECYGYEPQLRTEIEKELGTEQIEAVLEWCSRWGLLGVLPHMASFIQLAPQMAYEGYDNWERYPFKVTYERINGRWIDRHVCSRRKWRAYAKVTDQLLYETSFASEKTLTEAVWPFFPSAMRSESESWWYPLPLSDEFACTYAEPLSQFVYWAEILAIAVQQMSPAYLAYNLRELHDEEAFITNHHDFIPAVDKLLGPIAQTVTYSRTAKELSLKWNMPSLISSFALMAVYDSVAGTRVERCPSCMRMFTTSAYQAVYCSNKCAWTHRKRKKRASEKQTGKELMDHSNV